MTRRRTFRFRLALLFAGLLVVVGTALLALNYALVRRSIGPSVRDAGIAAVEARMPTGEETARAEQASGAADARPAPPGGEDRPGDPRTVTVEGTEFAVVEQVLTDVALDELLTGSVIALAVATAASGVIGWILAGRVLRPVQQVTETARRLSEHNLHERLRAVGPPDELKELADTFDAMLARLDAAFQAQQRFAANASHELRTPTALVRAAADVLAAKPSPTKADVDAAVTRIRAATDRSERTIAGLLLLARSEVADDERTEVDLADLGRAALDEISHEAQERHLRVECDLAPAPTLGSAELLRAMVANLVTNAVRHNVAGGYLAVCTGTRVGRARVTVENSGHPIDASAVDALLQPFRRGHDRTGSGGAGLGLSIVHAVVRAHDGQLHIAPRPGGGLVVRIELAALPPPPPRPR